MFTNPLDNIRVASPCPADWDQMFGDERTRFCSQCKLNVYNLSGMTRREAENLLINSEGGLCVRYYKRRDGTVLTKDCPVGWAALKRRVSRVATAVASVMIGFVSGILSVRSTEAVISSWQIGDVAPPNSGKVSSEIEPEVGFIVPYVQVLGALPESFQAEPVNPFDVGRVENTKRPRKKKPTRRSKPTGAWEVGGLKSMYFFPRSLKIKRGRNK